MPMSDAIENLAQDLSQVGVSPYEYPVLTDEGWVNTIPNPNFVEPYVYPDPPRFGLPEQPAGMFDPVLDYGTRQWLDRRMRSPNPTAQDLSNPSTLATGGEIDYNIPDDPTIRTNIGNTDEKDAFVRTGIGTTLDPKTEDTYGVTGLVPPGQAGGFVGVEYLDPSQVADLTAGQTPSSLPEEFITRGETIKIPGRGLPNFEAVGKNEDGIVYLDTVTRKVFFPGDPSYPGVSDLTGNPDLKSPSTLTKGTGTSVGAAQPTTTSEGGFNNTGGNVTVDPDNRAAGPGDTATVTPGGKPGVEPVDSGNEFYDSPFRTVTPEGIAEYKLQQQGWKIDENGNYLIWVPFDKATQERYNKFGNWQLAEDPRTTTGGETETPAPPTPPPGGGTTTTPPGGGGTTTPPGGGTTTTPPGGGVRPGTGTV